MAKFKLRPTIGVLCVSNGRIKNNLEVLNGMETEILAKDCLGNGSLYLPTDDEFKVLVDIIDHTILHHQSILPRMLEVHCDMITRDVKTTRISSNGYNSYALLQIIQTYKMILLSECSEYVRKAM